MMGEGRLPGVFGTVSAINGTTLTVAQVNPKDNTPATYSVDASAATVVKNGSASTLGAVAVGDSVRVAGTVNGTNVIATSIHDGLMGRGMGMRPGVVGTVSAINGNSLTVVAKDGWNGGAAGTTYSVDASAATITKNRTTVTVANIAVGDVVMVQGATNGTAITATVIRDGAISGGKDRGWGAAQAPLLQGNGQPVIGGAISAISGTTLTVTNKSNITYSVDASTATVTKGNATSSISAVTVGDNVIIQGTVNGTNVVAFSVIDQGSVNLSTATSPGTTPHQSFTGGFFQSVGGFFHRIFGFF
jgi:hypothetical protein